MLLALIVLAQQPITAPADLTKRAHTYSIVAYDSATGDLGIAVQSKFPNVGGIVPWAKAGVGAVATQSLGNTAYGDDGLRLMAMGATAPEAMRIVMRSDPRPSQRQVGMVDAHGNAASWTGDSCFDWAGGRRWGPTARSAGRERGHDRGARLRRPGQHHGLRPDSEEHGGRVRARHGLAGRPVDGGARGGAGGRRGQARHGVRGAARGARQRRVPRRQRPLHRHPRLRRHESDPRAAAAVPAAPAVLLPRAGPKT